jgi:hypothetical protein
MKTTFKVGREIFQNPVEKLIHKENFCQDIKEQGSTQMTQFRTSFYFGIFLQRFFLKIY